MNISMEHVCNKEAMNWICILYFVMIVGGYRLHTCQMELDYQFDGIQETVSGKR